MSFNFLRFGLNLNSNKKQLNNNVSSKINNKVEDEENLELNLNEEIDTKNILYPDCSKIKKNLLIYKKKIKFVENENISEKLKNKKLELLHEKLRIVRETLNEKLNLNSPQIEEVDPLCSFEEIQK